LQLGTPNDNPYLDRCQVLGGGASSNLPVNFPYPPSQPPHDGEDRFRVSCVKQERECGVAHRSTEAGMMCQEGEFLSMRIDYFMDCKHPDGCRAGSYDDRNDRTLPDEQKYCDRGKFDHNDPPFGYFWNAYLCKQDSQCVTMGNNVYGQGLSPADTRVAERQFITECCSMRSAQDVPCPDGSSQNCLLYRMCQEAENGVSLSFPLLSLVAAALVASSVL